MSCFLFIFFLTYTSIRLILKSIYKIKVTLYSFKLFSEQKQKGNHMLMLGILVHWH